MRRIRDVAGALTPRHWFLLWVLGAASFFEGYDLDIVTVALPQIRETFGLTQATAAIWLSVLYLGALPALFVSRWADRLGRRRVLLFSLTCYTVATGLTAFTPDIATYAAAQFVARLFLNAETAIVWTMVAEELPADSRGFGFGWLAMLTALGAGMSAILYAVAFHPNNLSWRWLYVVGLPPHRAITLLRRRLPQSPRLDAAPPSAAASTPPGRTAVSPGTGTRSCGHPTGAGSSWCASPPSWAPSPPRSGCSPSTSCRPSGGSRWRPRTSSSSPPASPASP